LGALFSLLPAVIYFQMAYFHPAMVELNDLTVAHMRRYEDSTI
jgi:hypothetical protein